MDKIKAVAAPPPETTPIDSVGGLETRPAPMELSVTLVRVVAPHFVAGLDIANGKCVEAAPILARLCKGKTSDQLRAIFKAKGWRASIINIDHVNQL